ncbi:MAG TPA: response regulator [Burkholderiaceae bacterium]|nr:response regulator [Burkholderiaceae bacterium]
MKRLLIIEDQLAIRQLIRITLELEDLEIHEAATGPEGLEAAQRLQPQVVLLDLMMPGGLDGFQVCERIRGELGLSNTKVVLMTARDQPEDRARGMKAGADEYLVKPFSPRELAGIVSRMT